MTPMNAMLKNTMESAPSPIRVETTALNEKLRPFCIIFILLITKALRKEPIRNAMKLATVILSVLPITSENAS